MVVNMQITKQQDPLLFDILNKCWIETIDQWYLDPYSTITVFFRKWMLAESGAIVHRDLQRSVPSDHPNWGQIEFIVEVQDEEKWTWFLIKHMPM